MVLRMSPAQDHTHLLGEPHTCWGTTHLLGEPHTCLGNHTPAWRILRPKSSPAGTQRTRRTRTGQPGTTPGGTWVAVQSLASQPRRMTGSTHTGGTVNSVPTMQLSGCMFTGEDLQPQTPEPRMASSSVPWRTECPCRPWSLHPPSTACPSRTRLGADRLPTPGPPPLLH